MNEEINPKAGASADGQLSEILLVLDKQQNKIQAVTGIDKDGKLNTVDATKKNQNQFMKIDLNGDAFTNFFSNFFRQLKDPTRFSFFKVPVAEAVETAEKMQKQVDNPDEKNKKILSDHEVKVPEETQKKDQKQTQNTMETTQTTQKAAVTQETSEYRYKPEQIDWETMSNLGLNREKLERMNLLEPLLKGYKTNELVPVSLNLGSSIIRLDARLSLQESGDGKVVMGIHGIRKEPNLNYPFFGHEFTPEDKEKLQATGNMGRVVELTHPKTKEKIPSIISVDRMTNELVALRTDWIKIPDEIKGVKLNDEQKQTLMKGEPLLVKDMISKKGEPFDATIQFNADKRLVEFLFDRTVAKREQVKIGDEYVAPRYFREKELDKEQYEKFKTGQTIYVEGLTDKKGKSYDGYITFNKATGNIDFSFKNANMLKEKVVPVEGHKTQVAVNSEGKTNEATKNLKEPLKTGQTEPDSKKQQQKQEKPRNKVKQKL